MPYYTVSMVLYIYIYIHIYVYIHTYNTIHTYSIIHRHYLLTRVSLNIAASLLLLHSYLLLGEGSFTCMYLCVPTYLKNWLPTEQQVIVGLLLAKNYRYRMAIRFFGLD
jgi:hypothetical protein